MFYLTKQERIVVSAFALIVFCGLAIQLIAKRYPHLGELINVVENDQLMPKLDVNKASYDELVAVPYIGPYTANQIIHYRQEHGSIIELEELKQIKGIKDSNFQKFSRYLEIKPKIQHRECNPRG